LPPRIVSARAFGDRRPGRDADDLSDPFDRLLVAQASQLGVPTMTADPAFAAYGVEIITVR
jgi:PIN domain nuclease of toxin-antitoxin system